MSVAKLQLISAGGEFQHIYTVCVIILGLAWFPLPYLAPFPEQEVKKIIEITDSLGDCEY